MPLADKDPSRAERREEEHLICPQERRTKTGREREGATGSSTDKESTNKDHIKSFRVETFIL